MKKICFLLCLVLIPTTTLAKTKVEEENEKHIKEEQKITEEYHRKIKIRDIDFKRAGYAGYIDGGIPSFIFKIRKEGINKYLNYVVGCIREHPKYEGCYADPDYLRTRIISITNNGLLYQYLWGDYGKYSLTFFVTLRKTDKLYQDGQTLEKGDYVFIGTYRYQTVMGNISTVPAFKKIR